MVRKSTKKSLIFPLPNDSAPYSDTTDWKWVPKVTKMGLPNVLRSFPDGPKSGVFASFVQKIGKNHRFGHFRPKSARGGGVRGYTPAVGGQAPSSGFTGELVRVQMAARGDQRGYFEPKRGNSDPWMVSSRSLGQAEGLAKAKNRVQHVWRMQ